MNIAGGFKSSFCIYKTGRDRRNDCDVAVKKLRSDYSESDRYKTFLSEIRMSGRKPFFALLFGVMRVGSDVFLVSEWCEKRSLCDVMQRKNEVVSWRRTLKWSLQTAEALVALHKLSFLHCALRSTNVLISSKDDVKLTDSGNPHFFDISEHPVLSSPRSVSSRHLAAHDPPERYFGDRASYGGDTFSFGVFLWELSNRCVTGEFSRPYAEFPQLTKSFQITLGAARKKLRPTIAPSMPTSVARLIERCWQHESSARPSSSEALTVLRECQTSYDATPTLWTDSFVGNGLASKHAHRKIVDLCLLLVDLSLPHYCLLWIIDWLEEMAMLKHLTKLRLIERVNESIQRIIELRSKL